MIESIVDGALPTSFGPLTSLTILVLRRVLELEKTEGWGI